MCSAYFYTRAVSHTLHTSNFRITWLILLVYSGKVVSVVHLLTKKKKNSACCVLMQCIKLRFFFLLLNDPFSLSLSSQYHTHAAMALSLPLWLGYILCVWTCISITHSIPICLSIVTSHTQLFLHLVLFKGNDIIAVAYYYIFFSTAHKCERVIFSFLPYIWINRKLCIYQLPAYVYIYISKGLVLCPGTWLLYYYCKLLWCVWLHYVAWST
jgi:hypothetical protein